MDGNDVDPVKEVFPKLPPRADQTGKIAVCPGGRISDFGLGDVDDDGDPELVVSLVAKEGDIAFTEARSSLVIYESITP